MIVKKPILKKSNSSINRFKTKLNPKDKILFKKNLKNVHSYGRFSILVLSICLLFVVAFFRSINGSDPLTFTGLLETLSNSPQIALTNFLDLSIGGDWGILDFFRDFINILGSVLSVVVWIFSQLIQCLQYFVFIVDFVFIG